MNYRIQYQTIFHVIYKQYDITHINNLKQHIYMIFLMSLYLFSNSGNRKLENWSLLPNGPTTSLSKIKKSVSSLYGSESSASTLYLDEVHKELTKSKNNYLLEDETDGIRRMEKYNSPNERSNIHLNAAGKNNFKRDPVVLQNIVQNETLNKSNFDNLGLMRTYLRWNLILLQRTYTHKSNR